MASIQKFSRLGQRIYWRLYLPDGTYKEKYKASKSKSALKEILPDIMKIETLSRRNELSGQDLLRALHLRIVTRDELQLFSSDVEIQEDHYLSELREDFEIKSKAQSSSNHCHRSNMCKAAIIENYSYFKETPINRITTELIEKFRAHRRNKVTNTTVNHDLKALRKYFDIAISKGFTTKNPARDVTLLKEPKNRIPRCFYPEEIKLLFSRLQDFEHLLNGEFAFIVRCLAYTGLRRSELRSLKPENIKLHLRQIHLIGKGKKARVVGIHHSLMEEFKARIKRGYILHPSINPSSISHAFKQVLKHLRLPESLTLHSLRHTYITYLLQQGIPSKRVKERAGHFSLTVTDLYTHALPSDTVDEDTLDFESITL
jgi:site-specific recombinase XerD